MADNNYQQLIDDSKRYLRMRYDMLRLELLEKLSRIVALILLVVVSTVLALATFVHSVKPGSHHLSLKSVG